MKKDKIIYSLTLEDVQTVAEQELNRRLSEKELKAVEDKLSVYIAWYESITNLFQDLELKKGEE